MYGSLPDQYVGCKDFGDQSFLKEWQHSFIHINCPISAKLWIFSHYHQPLLVDITDELRYWLRAFRRLALAGIIQVLNISVIDSVWEPTLDLDSFFSTSDSTLSYNVFKALGLFFEPSSVFISLPRSYEG